LETSLKNLKHEAELFKGAMLAGVKYAEGRGVVEFEATDSASEKLLYIYRLLVHDKVIQPYLRIRLRKKTLRHKTGKSGTQSNMPKRPSAVNKTAASGAALRPPLSAVCSPCSLYAVLAEWLRRSFAT